jgi:hypothetical protein
VLWKTVCWLLERGFCLALSALLLLLPLLEHVP